MAPEVIELSGVSTASDIWSVGCTIIELMTGEPPYSDLGPLPAMFRIVQEDHPPLPDGVSEPLEDFMLLCFQRDPKLRSSATKLKKHKWVQQALKTSQADFHGAVKSVQEWNEALDSSLRHGMKRTTSTVDRNSMIFDSLKIASIKLLKSSPSAAKEDKPRPADPPLKIVKPEVVSTKKSSAPASPFFDSLQSTTQLQKKFAEADSGENWDGDFTGEFQIGGNSDGNTILPNILARQMSFEDQGTVKVIVKKPAEPVVEPAHLRAPSDSSSHSSSRFNSSLSGASSSVSSTKLAKASVDSDDDSDWSEFSEEAPKIDLSRLARKGSSILAFHPQFHADQCLIVASLFFYQKLLFPSKRAGRLTKKTPRRTFLTSLSQRNIRPNFP